MTNLVLRIQIEQMWNNDFVLATRQFLLSNEFANKKRGEECVEWNLPGTVSLLLAAFPLKKIEKPQPPKSFNLDRNFPSEKR